MTYTPTPVADHEVRELISALTRYPSGVTRKQLAAMFGSDRRGRQIVAATVERGEAAIVHDRDLDTYRVARTQREVDAEAQVLTRYARSIERRCQGLLRAFEAGGVARRQPGMFDPGLDPG